jgi:hypothetical protein
MEEEISDKCAPNDEGDSDDYSNACCAARKCFMMPKSPNKCCNGPGTKTQMTGHHLLPSHEFVIHDDRTKLDPATNYKSDDAPCLSAKSVATTPWKKRIGWRIP